MKCKQPHPGFLNWVAKFISNENNHYTMNSSLTITCTCFTQLYSNKIIINAILITDIYSLFFVFLVPRYTEGDFHYLKRLRVEKLSGPICKQLSLGSRNSINNENNMDTRKILSDSSMCEGVESKARGSFLMPSIYSVSQQCIEESPSPTSKPTQTEISVEIHCQQNEISNPREAL